LQSPSGGFFHSESGFEPESFVLKAPTGAQKFYSSQAAFPERTSYLVRIETDAGI
jgi:hypothetical protein